MVPKCKECEYHRKIEALTYSAGSIKTTYLKKYDSCFYTEGSYPVIESKELRTSPIWCPKRANS